jgi:hypothetical protein
MAEEIIYYITPKFWPDKEDKDLPLDKDVDYTNPFDVLKHRQKVRLFYRNWVEVWRTYAYYSKWAIGVVPLVGVLTNSKWATGVTFILWLSFRIYFSRKLTSIVKFKFIATAILDRFIEPHIGPIEPFE